MNIFKQIITVLLSAIFVTLVFSIILYKYIPTNKVVPTKVTAYQTPESVEEEIKDTSTEQEFASTNQTYEITDSDLSLYQTQKSYNPGKSDPFKEYSEAAESNLAGETTTNNGSTGNTNSKTENKNTTNNYYKAAGIEKGGK